MNRPSDGIKISQDQIRAIDDYAEYKRIVGEDDGGTLFTPEQYEAYKKKYIPIRTRNRIFISLVNPNEVDCVLAGPQTECFCQHRLIQHKTDYETLPSTRPIPVPCRRCNCESFSVMPKFGTQTARCHCKHLAAEHSVENLKYNLRLGKLPDGGNVPSSSCNLNTLDRRGDLIKNFVYEDLIEEHFQNFDKPRPAKENVCHHVTSKPPNFCSKPNCMCAGFKTSVNCDCGIEFYKHRMVMETTQERLARGRPIGKPCPYQAMGGLTGFASLSPGISRMEESGAGGMLTKEELNAPITSNDHPFLRTQAQAVYAYKLAQNDLKGAERERPEVESQMRRPGESELDYYERRYQEREKAKYVRKPAIKKP